MKRMPKNDFLCKLVEQHPEQGSEIASLAREDPDFMSICEDIGLAEEALARWQDLPCRAVEYEEILDGLKKEFWSKLSTRTGCASSDDVDDTSDNTSTESEGR
ncbi:hypothetical protein [Defluviimonas salinarum]|uniref:Uncharacterized protein n=1 Tax=Defluviimonas salinarum TaxID=2992147 RepID=A0ABT3J6U7_9RHOB|nr:hypothetical protein [Defluviimonas salinarum]MCW3783409.1 hypothetical protein [Defluviimonas salinarum]